MTPTHPDTQERQGDRATAIRPRVTGVLGETRIHCVLSAEPQLFIHGAESISTSGGALRMVSQLIFGWKDLNMGFLFCFNFFSLFFFSQMAVMVQPTSQVRSRAANDYFTFAV